MAKLPSPPGTLRDRVRLLSESEAPPTLDSTACSVEDVLHLLQLLYAVSMEKHIGNWRGNCKYLD